jgi:hypothetical protein
MRGTGNLCRLTIAVWHGAILKVLKLTLPKKHTLFEKNVKKTEKMQF